MTEQEIRLMNDADLKSKIGFYKELITQEENDHNQPFGLKMERLYELDNDLDAMLTVAKERGIELGG